MCIADARSPLTHGFGNRIFERCCPRLYGDNLCAEKPHTIYIESLTDGIFFSHENHAFHAHQRCCGCRSNAVLTCPGFGDQTCFTHLLCQKCPTEYIVDLCARMV